MNIIDEVSISPQAAREWARHVRAALARLAAEQGRPVRPDEVGLEEAHEQPDGTLLISCRIGQFYHMLRVPAEHWCMAN